MEFPKISNQFLLNRLEAPRGKISMVLDTDTYNEIDDQFALVYALTSGDRISVEAVYAAPFCNPRATTPGEGMEKSYEEILRVLTRMNRNADGFVFKGSRRYLESMDTPCESEAARDLVDRAMNAEGPLYVAAIGAITNIASAILLEPRIIEKIVVVWLSGTSLYWPSAREFNLEQDVYASKILFNCGVPLIHIPCTNVTSHLITTTHEIKHYLQGKNEIADYLCDIFMDYSSKSGTMSKVLWDIAVIAWLVHPQWVPEYIVHSPVLTDNLTWSTDERRHFIKSAFAINRDAVFGDLFQKICHGSAETVQ